MGAVIGAVLRGRTPKKRFGVLRAHKAWWVQAPERVWRRFPDVRKRAQSRKKRYPILFRNHPGIPDFVNFPLINFTIKQTVVGVLQASSSCGQGGENPVSGYVHVLDMCLA